MCLKYALRLVINALFAYLKAYPEVPSHSISLTVKFSIVTSPFSKKKSFVLVAAVGLSCVERSPCPIILTPFGTVSGATSSNVPLPK